MVCFSFLGSIISSLFFQIRASILNWIVGAVTTTPIHIWVHSKCSTFLFGYISNLMKRIIRLDMKKTWILCAILFFSSSLSFSFPLSPVLFFLSFFFLPFYLYVSKPCLFILNLWIERNWNVYAIGCKQKNDKIVVIFVGCFWEFWAEFCLSNLFCHKNWCREKIRVCYKAIHIFLNYYSIEYMYESKR